MEKNQSISFCLLIVPCLAVRKGYLQGQKFISVSSTSQLIEQIVRIAFILVGSYLAINIYKMDVSFGVAIAVFGAFVAGVAAFLYLEYKIRKNKKELNIPSNKKKDKVIYLTFDCGYENGNTKSILDTLKKNKIKAIFFVTEPYIRSNPGLVKRMKKT